MASIVYTVYSWQVVASTGLQSTESSSLVKSTQQRPYRWYDSTYIYIIYTPNLGLGITAFVREREQGRFRGSTEGARGRSKGAPREHGWASREHGGASREHGGASREHGGAAREQEGARWGSAGPQPHLIYVMLTPHGDICAFLLNDRHSCLDSWMWDVSSTGDMSWGELQGQRMSAKDVPWSRLQLPSLAAAYRSNTAESSSIHYCLTRPDSLTTSCLMLVNLPFSNSMPNICGSQYVLYCPSLSRLLFHHFFFSLCRSLLPHSLYCRPYKTSFSKSTYNLTYIKSCDEGFFYAASASST